MPGAVSAFWCAPGLGVAASVWAAELLRTDLTTTGDTCPLTLGCGYETPGYRIVIVASTPGFPSQGERRHKEHEAVLPCHTARRQLGLCQRARELFGHGCCVTAKCKVTLGGFTFVAACVLKISFRRQKRDLKEQECSAEVGNGLFCSLCNKPLQMPARQFLVSLDLSC